jgi:hypothetical protein
LVGRSGWIEKMPRVQDKISRSKDALLGPLLGGTSPEPEYLTKTPL